MEIANPLIYQRGNLSGSFTLLDVGGHLVDMNNCVELAAFGEGRTVRDSKDPTGPVLTFTTAEWSVFTTGIRGGEFD